MTFNLALRAIDISMAELRGGEVSGICVSGFRPAADGEDRR